MAGRFLLDRSIFRYAEKPFTEFEAWVWTIAYTCYHGEHKGCLFCGRIHLGKQWGWKPEKVRKILRRWQDQERISIQVVQLTDSIRAVMVGGTRGQDQGSGPWVGTRDIMQINLPNYTDYQSLTNNPGPGVRTRGQDQGSGPGVPDAYKDRGLIFRNEKENTKKIQTATTPPPSAPPPHAKGNLKSFEETRKIIESLDLEPFRTKYPYLNINDEYQAFYDHFLFANDLKSGGKPNWKKWSDWNRAFHNWCNKPWKKTAANEDWRI